jgi:hypothetical protein
MQDVVLYGSIAVLGYYFLTRIFGFLAMKINWGWWYRNIYLRSWHWKIVRWKKKIQSLILYGAVKCEKCGSRKYLQFHHINYKHLGWERMSDLQILCRYHHRQGSGKI